MHHKGSGQEFDGDVGIAIGCLSWKRKRRLVKEGRGLMSAMEKKNQTGKRLGQAGRGDDEGELERKSASKTK